MAYIVSEKNTFLEFVSAKEYVAQPRRRHSWSIGASGDNVPFDPELVPLWPLSPVQSGGFQCGPCPKEAEAKLTQHAEGTCKPCIFFASNAGCTRVNCSFCHLAHTPPSGKRPRKQIRETYKAAVEKVFETVKEPDALHAALQDLAAQDRYVRLLVIGEIESRFGQQCSSPQ
mmetsp:Transcript_51649/g.63206  ORF Transcript_51649/g.63206 Transcript_51649/m.63206 type:complete len:172 (-) Transcript_51649:86-601(-)